MKCEILRIASLIQGTSSLAEMEDRERRYCGKTFAELVLEGYHAQLVIEDKNGASWNVNGRL